MTRSEARNLAFGLVYSLEIQKLDSTQYEEQINLFLETENIEEKNAKKYIVETLNGIKQNEEEIVKIISDNLNEKWNIGRVSKINLSLLKLAVYEIKYAKLPFKAIINEVVELAKKYGEDNSPSFINGILANIMKKYNIEEI